MKIKFVIIAIGLMGILFSCKKAYRCVCEEGKVVNSYEDKLSKSEAETEKGKCEFTEGCTFERDK